MLEALEKKNVLEVLKRKNVLEALERKIERESFDRSQGKNVRKQGAEGTYL